MGAGASAQHRTHIGLGLRAVAGGAVAVALGGSATAPRLIVSSLLSTGAADDRLALEPYHVAVRSSEPAALAAEGRRRQVERLTAELAAIKRHCTGAPIRAGLLVNRAGWVTDLLEYSLAWPEHVPVAEGLAVRDALRAACAAHGMTIVELDEKSLLESARSALGLTAAAIETRVKELGAAAGRPWRKEQKLACLAAWIAARADRSRDSGTTEHGGATSNGSFST